MAEVPKAQQRGVPAAPKEPWLVRELVGEFVFAPLVRGALWLVLHAVLMVKRLLLP